MDTIVNVGETVKSKVCEKLEKMCENCEKKLKKKNNMVR